MCALTYDSTTKIPPIIGNSFTLAKDDTEGSACAKTEGEVYYFSAETLNSGDALFTDSALTTFATEGWYADLNTRITYWINVPDGVVAELGSCIKTFQLCYDAESQFNYECTEFTTYYSTDSTLAINSILYNDAALSQPVSDGYYYLATEPRITVYTVTGNSGAIEIFSEMF